MKERIYTSDGTVKTPDGREFVSLKFAAKAYGYTEEEVLKRIEEGCSLREAFLGRDLPCGLKYGLDRKLHDYDCRAFDTLEDMCKAHKADVEWFEKIYAVTKDLKMALKQESRTQEFLDNYVRNKRIQEENERKKAERLEEDRKRKSALHNRAVRAKKIYKRYCTYYRETYGLMPLEIAWQVLRLGDFLDSFNMMDYEDKKLYLLAQTAVFSGESNALLVETIPNEKLINEILGNFACTGSARVLPEKEYLPSDKRVLDEFIKNETYRQSLINKRKAARQELKETIERARALKAVEEEARAEAKAKGLNEEETKKLVTEACAPFIKVKETKKSEGTEETEETTEIEGSEKTEGIVEAEKPVKTAKATKAKSAKKTVTEKRKEELKKKQREEEAEKRRKRMEDTELLSKYGSVMVDDYGQFIILNKIRVRADDIRNNTSTFVKASAKSVNTVKTAKEIVKENNLRAKARAVKAETKTEATTSDINLNIESMLGKMSDREKQAALIVTKSLLREINK